MDTHNTLTTADRIDMLTAEIEAKIKHLNELKGVSLAESRATLSAPIPTPTASGISTAIVDAPTHEPGKTIEQIRAGRRWAIGVGKEPRTPEGDIFIFLEYVEKLIRSAKMREERKSYRTALMRCAEEAEIYLKSAYKACEELRTSNT